MVADLLERACKTLKLINSMKYPRTLTANLAFKCFGKEETLKVPVNLRV
jgi:hypothetical protein